MKKNDTVYYYDKYTETIVQATIEDSTGDKGKEWLKLHYGFGSLWADKEDVFPSKKACMAAIDAAHEQRQAEYMERIHDTSDLIRFIFSHYMPEDHDAEIVAKKKSLELLGIDLTDAEPYTDDIPVCGPVSASDISEAPSFEGVIPVAGA